MIETVKRTSAKKKAHELAKYLRPERPDYDYLKALFKHLRDELDVKVKLAQKNYRMCPPKRRLSVITKRSGNHGTFKTWLSSKRFCIRAYVSVSWLIFV